MKWLIPAMLLFAFMLAGALIAPGCAVDANRPAPTTQQLATEINIDVFTAADGYIILARDEAGRQQRAREVFVAASELKAAAASDIDVSDLRQVALKIITARLDKDDQVIARFAVNVVLNHVRRRLGIDSMTLVPADRLPITRALITAGSQGAIDAAKQYLQ